MRTTNHKAGKCHLRECDSCPGVEEIKYLITLFDHMIEFKQWTNVDRSSLETITMPADEYVELFSEKLEALCPHSFIATQRSRFFSECKSTLKPREIVVSADFSENYTFVFQDAAQGFHWNNAQATIHPFVVYYKESGEEHHLSFVVISDCLHHDTVAVYGYVICFPPTLMLWHTLYHYVGQKVEKILLILTITTKPHNCRL